MAEIVRTEPALDDLDEIAEYIALDKPVAAEHLVRHIFSRVDRLSDSPDSGRRVPELSPSRYRELIVGPCRIFYRPDEDSVCQYRFHHSYSIRMDSLNGDFG